MFERFTDGARSTVVSAVEEARQRGDRRIGTEHLFLGLLHAADSPAVQALGVGLPTARTALADLDQAALTAIGVDTHGIERPPVPVSRKRTPFTSGARSVLPRALTEARRGAARRITPEHLLLAMLECERPDPAAELMDRLGVDRTAVRDRLRQHAG